MNKAQEHFKWKGHCGDYSAVGSKTAFKDIPPPEQRKYVIDYTMKDGDYIQNLDEKGAGDTDKMSKGDAAGLVLQILEDTTLSRQDRFEGYDINMKKADPFMCMLLIGEESTKRQKTFLVQPITLNTPVMSF